MRVSPTGQVTIPKELRVKFGLTPATEIEFIEHGGMIALVKKPAKKALSGYRGIATKKNGFPRTTNEFLTLLRT